MPTGIYIRTEKHKEIGRRNLKKAGEISWKLPRTRMQIETSRKAAYKMNKLPKTQKQRETSRQNAHKMILNNIGKSHKGTVFANDIVKHHNDLVHGALRPDDITPIIHSEHSRLHANLRVENGTNPFLAKRI